MNVEIEPNTPPKHGKSSENLSGNLSSNPDQNFGISNVLGSEVLKEASETGVFEANSSGTFADRGTLDSRSKSSLRIRYEAEVKIIRRKLGDLEQIRATLGLSQRKISQLLFVDPSAWTRWTRAGEQAPPHIYRMLQWYLALEDKYPALDTTFWLSAVAKVRAPVEDQRELEILRAEHNQLKREVALLRERREVASSPQVAVPKAQNIWAFIAVGFFISFLLGIGMTLLIHR